MTTVTCCAPTLAPSIPALPRSPTMPRILPRVDAAAVQVPPAAIRLHRPAWSRAWSAAVEGWAAWRAQARYRAELRALAALDRHVLRDVGLDDIVPPRRAASWQDIERARW